MVLLMVGGVGWWATQGPFYHLRRVSYWLELLERGEPDENDAARQAVQALGKRAIPRMIELARATEVPFFYRYRQSLQVVLGGHVSEVELESVRKWGRRGLEILGTNALPELTGLLRDRRSHVRFMALELIGRLGPAAQSSTAAVRPLLAETGEIRWSACMCLGHIGPGAREAIPDLLELMTSAAGEQDPTHLSQVFFALDSIDPSLKRTRADVRRVEAELARKRMIMEAAPVPGMYHYVDRSGR